jgi:hypothetical protein
MKIITATYKDKHKLDSWIPNIIERNIDYIIYEKDDNLQLGESIVVDKNNIKIPNYGRCDYAFLYHIIHNYDNLDDRNIFVKSHWADHRLDLYYIINNASKYDWMEPGTDRIHQYWTNKQSQLLWPSEIIYNSKHIFAQTCYDWYFEIFPNIDPPEIVHGWGQFPCFSVSKRLIHRHPKEVYIKLLNKFHVESNSWDTVEASKYYNTIEKQIIDVGKHYHDQFGRFYQLLFTHNLNDDSFIIHK